MDSGWAVVLGAVIALVGSAVLPWAREWFTDGRAERRRVEQAKAAAIKDVVHALTKLATVLPSSDGETREQLEGAAQDAMTSLELLLALREQPVAAMLEAAFSDACSSDMRLRPIAKAAVPPLLGAWFRGGFSPLEVEASYQRNRAEAVSAHSTE